MGFQSLVFQKEQILNNVAKGAAANVNPRGLFFKPEGDRVYVAGAFADATSPSSNKGKIVEFNLSSSWDIGTLLNPSAPTVYTSSFLNTKDTVNDNVPQGVFFKPDGSRLFFVGEQTSKIYQFDLSENWNISSATVSANAAVQNGPRDLFWHPDGTVLYVCDNNLDQVKQYNVPTAWDITSISGYGGGTLTETSNADFSTAPGAPAIGSIEAFSIKPDGKTVFLLEQAGTDTLHEFLLNSPWTFRTISGNPDVTYVNSTTIINTSEDSNRGMFIRDDGKFLYAAGVNTEGIQQYTMLSNNKNDFNLKFQGTHLIYENEYQCTVDEHEYNFTLNPSARKNRNTNSQDLATFATGSTFKPYVTTIGLYNEEGELLVVGKLGQATRMSDETDTTFVIRWDK